MSRRFKESTLWIFLSMKPQQPAKRENRITRLVSLISSITRKLDQSSIGRHKSEYYYVRAAQSWLMGVKRGERVAQVAFVWLECTRFTGSSTGSGSSSEQRRERERESGWLGFIRVRASPIHIVQAPPNAPQAKSTGFKCTYMHVHGRV